MAKKTKDTATANEVAMSSNVDKQEQDKLPIGDQPGISGRLFPDFEETPENTDNEPSNPQKMEASPEKQEANQSKTPAPDETEYLDMDKISGKKLKLKSDGVEFDGTIADFAKRVGSQETIDRRFQKLAQERKEMLKERQEVLDLKKQVEDLKSNFQGNQSKTEPSEYHDTSYSDDPVVKELLNRNKSLEEKLAQFSEGINPLLVKMNKDSVAAELKREGFKDADNFDAEINTYLGKIEDDMLLKMEVDKANTIEGAKDIYRKIQLQKLMQEKEAASNTPQKAEPEVRTPPIVDIDSGSGQASGAKIDDWKHKYEEVRKRAMSGDQEAWNQLVQMKYQ